MLQHVWSESEDCLPFLQLAQDYISSCGKKTLLEVLEKVFTSFRPVRKLTSAPQAFLQQQLLLLEYKAQSVSCGLNIRKADFYFDLF